MSEFGFDCRVEEDAHRSRKAPKIQFVIRLGWVDFVYPYFQSKRNQLNRTK